MLHWLYCAICTMVLSMYEVVAECDQNITTPLKSHIVSNAIEYFRGNFTDVWASKYVTEMLNGSYTSIWEGGEIMNCVVNKDGRGYSASGKIWSDEEGIIHIKVEGFDIPGIIFPLFASPTVIAFYTCYPNVEGSGVSVIAARRDLLFLPETIEHVLEAKVMFSTLQEKGIPINDGVDYDQQI